MSPSLEHIDACLPIAALKILIWGEKRLIFQGQGALFRVVNEANGAISTQLQVFKRNNIHGFIVLNQRAPDDSDTIQVLVWGGQSVRVINLSLKSGTEPTLSISSAEFNAPDWIMNGCAAAATGHYGGFLITANNSLLSLEIVRSEVRSQAALSIYQLATSVKSILYSADVLALSSSHVLIAAGTVFGEIIVWSCFMTNEESHRSNAVGSIHHVFTGHEGSIFNVRISPQIHFLNNGQSGRLLASCSDDRTVRIWDISGCEHKTALDPSAYSTDGHDLRSTGFGQVEAGEQTEGSESCLAQAFGHAARIWGIHFRSIENKDQTHMGLVSRGEDCTCVLWNLRWKTTSAGFIDYQLDETSSVQAHFGKHIWSLDLHRLGPQTVVYTGGADGALRRFHIEENDDTCLPESPIPEPEIPGYPKKKRTVIHCDKPRSFAFLSPSCILCVSTYGQIQLGQVNQKGGLSITWDGLCEIPDLRSFSMITSLPRNGLALIGDSQGIIRLYNHAVRSITEVANVGMRALGIFFLQTDSLASLEKIIFLCHSTKAEAKIVTLSDWNSDCPQSDSIALSLPDTFAVRSASLILGGQYLMLGSRGGGLAVYQMPANNQFSEPIFLDRRMHGREFVNHIHVVPSITGIVGKTLEYVLTCGRDGTYCLHELQLDHNKPNAFSIETVHRMTSGVGGNIEGSYLDEVTGDLMLYGFRSQNWVLRNESKLTDIITIASGGFRRDWAFFQPTKDDDKTFFMWKNGASLIPTPIQPDASRLLLRAGTHGRELRAVDVFCAPQGSRSLIATGAEDTIVRILAPTSSVSSGPCGAFECVRVLETHTSGIQQVSWSKDGKYLFTSAALEEFFVWQVRMVPPFGIATKLLAASPKEDPGSDLRVLSFDLLDVEEMDGEQGFLLCLALSNSVFKIFHFSPSSCQFALLARGKYMTNCLTQAHFLTTSSSVSLITAATDGYFTLWDLTSTLEPFYHITKPKLKAKDIFSNTFIPTEDITCEGRYQIHSNSVKGMELVSLSDTATVIMAGGDDNSVSVSLLRTSPRHADTDTHVATISIPDAHAAAVTSVKVLSQRKVLDATSGIPSTEITLASSGNDHRVKIWSIIADETTPGTDSISTKFLFDKYSAVADISSLGLVPTQGHNVSADSSASDVQSNQAQLMVCGVGMELFDIKP